MLLVSVLAVVAFAVSWALTPLCRFAARRAGLLDLPDQCRKLHRIPVPRAGGVPIFLAIGTAVGACALLHRPFSGMTWDDATRLMPAVAVVFLTGLVDDIRGLRPWQKLVGQIVAAALACGAGVRIDSLAGYNIEHAWWRLPLTAGWLVVCSNAFNLIDGVDGLAAGVGLFATMTTLISALLGHHLALALATAPLAGALLGFLRYNLNPATIFLGDCGSLSIGFLLGCYGVIWSQKSATLLGMTAPLIALCIPILETAISLLRRLLRGLPIFGADRRHIHHRLLDLGFSSRGVLMLMYGAAGIAAACSLLITVSNARLGGLIVLFFCAGAWNAVRRLGYGEFAAARQVVFGGLVQSAINAQVSLKQLDAGLSAAATDRQRWLLLADASRKMGFRQFRLDLGGDSWTGCAGSAPLSECWQMRIPLNGSGVACFSIPLAAPIPPVMLASFAAIVWRSLGGAPRGAPMPARHVSLSGAVPAGVSLEPSGRAVCSG